MCEFDPEDGGYMTWCTECNDYPDADIDGAAREYWADAIDAAKARRNLPWTEWYDKPARND